ncbi:MAG: putative thiamine biosynthesis protein [Paracidovorax wautersii]|uniref:Putative thiamine biosynthesis protein n=1 Tax=Paracidovorax wautersii TaxID=1177982 RepID=A0A7V8JR49_9BURK|nr:MAG: putative thiamine biosynthesis protein [Paracidovorax wautersii]
MSHDSIRAGLSRRRVLRATGAFAQPKKKITLAWSQASYCHSPIPVAFERGIFEQNGLQVETLNWAGAADQLLEALATNKADVGVGLIHRWLKPLEAGFDVKVVGSVHGGCLRLVGLKSAGITSIEQLRGKAIGVSDLNSPAKNFFDIHLYKNGIKNVEYRVYPADLLDVAVKKGEIQAIADGDPNVYLIEKRNPGVFAEIGDSGTGEYAQKICCVLAASGKLVREDRATAAAVVRSLAQAAQFTADNPNEAARLYAKYTPKITEAELRSLIHTTNYAHHPAGQNLRAEVEYFAQDFRKAGILKTSTDPKRFAEVVTTDVLA